MRSFLFIILTAFIILGNQSCKEGCTNPTALNYDSKAKSDDASCMYCDTVYTEVRKLAEWTINDPDPDSEMFAKDILKARVTNYKQTLTGNNCIISEDVEDSTCITFSHTIQFKNVCDKTVDVQGNLRVRYVQNGVAEYTTSAFGPLVLAQGETINTEPFLNVCVENENSAIVYIGEIVSYTLSYK